MRSVAQRSKPREVVYQWSDDEGEAIVVNAGMDRALAATDGRRTFDLPEFQADEQAMGALHHRWPCGYKDPFCVLLVVDAWSRMSSVSFLRATYMTRWLNRHRRNFLWNATTVGRIMGEVFDLAIETYGPDACPIVQVSDYKGTYFLMPNEDEARMWLLKVRTALWAPVNAMKDDETLGRSSEDHGTVFTVGMDLSRATVPLEGGVMHPERWVDGKRVATLRG